MFEAPVALAWDRRQHGQKAAVEIVGDIHEYTKFYSPKEPVDYPWINARQLCDFNEHFMEWGTPMRDRATAVMLAFFLVVMIVVPCLLALAILRDSIQGKDVGFLLNIGAIAISGFALFAAAAYWEPPKTLWISRNKFASH